MKIGLSRLAAWSLAATAAPAVACVPPPPPVPLPGESAQAYKERSAAIVAAEARDYSRRAQSAMFDQARSVFVGRVSSSREIPVGSLQGREVSVRPVAAIKGLLPAAPASVRDIIFTDCGMSGGGSATSAQPGDYVIVFAGLAPTEMRGTNVGILAKEAELPQLLGALATIPR